MCKLCALEFVELCDQCEYEMDKHYRKTYEYGFICKHCFVDTILCQKCKSSNLCEDCYILEGLQHISTSPSIISVILLYYYDFVDDIPLCQHCKEILPVGHIWSFCNPCIELFKNALPLPTVLSAIVLQYTLEERVKDA